MQNTEKLLNIVLYQVENTLLLMKMVLKLQRCFSMDLEPTEPQDVPNEYLTMIFNLGQSGIKKLISLSFKGEHINLIKVIATKDSDELTESREYVRITFMNCQNQNIIHLVMQSIEMVLFISSVDYSI